LALSYAVTYPKEVAAIVLLAPAAYADGGSNQFVRRLIETPVIGNLTLAVGRLILGKHILKRELTKAFSPDAVPENYLRHVSSEWLRLKQLRAFIHDEYSLNKDLAKISQYYAQINIPVVIVTGDQDKIVSPERNAYHLKATIAQAQLLELKNTGHQIPQTHPESVSDAVTLISKSSARLSSAPQE